MALRMTPFLLCTLGLGSMAQAPLPPPAQLPPQVAPPAVAAPAPQATPAPAPPAEAKSDDATALKAALEALQARLRQQEEDGLLRVAELRKAQADILLKLAALDTLPARMKTLEEQAKASEDLVAAQAKGQAALVQARLAGEQKLLLASLGRLEGIRKDLAAPGPLADLDQALAQCQEASRLSSQPQFTEMVEIVKAKLLKGPLGDPLRDAPATGSFFANATLGGDWTTAAVLLGPGWDSDKMKTLGKAYAAVDAATRLEGDLKTAQALTGALQEEASLLAADVEETALRAQLQLNPMATSPQPLAGEAFSALVEAAFKPLLEASAQGGLPAGARDTLVELVGIRDEAEIRSLEQRLFLRRVAGVATGLAQTFHARRKEAGTRELPALDALVKALDAVRGRLKAKVIVLPPEGKERAQLMAAGYPVR